MEKRRLIMSIMWYRNIQNEENQKEREYVRGRREIPKQKNHKKEKRRLLLH